MTFKKISLVFLFLCALFIIFFVTQKTTLIPKKTLAQAEKSSDQVDKKIPLKNRFLEVGQPQFIKENKKSFPQIKRYIKEQWALKDIDFLEAWKNVKEEKTKKPSIIVAVVDTGIHIKHSCLKNSLWINKKEIPGNGKDDDNNGFIDDIHGWNFVNNNNNIQDYQGHGTHVSGIIAAQGTTPQSPNCTVMGVAAPHVQIMTLKYFDEGADSDNVKNTVKAIKYAIDNGADIINYSGGGPGANADEKAAIAMAADKNIIFVAALGNEGSYIGKKIKYYPASYEFPNIISVLSKNKEEDIIKSSNRIKLEPLENKLTQNAPGENIISTLPPQIYLRGNLKARVFRQLASHRINHDNYGRMTGTSQATAVVTGVVALVKTKYPLWTMEKQIDQLDKTGIGQQGTEKIKEATNQGKKLSAEQALIMRGQNIDSSDQIDNTNAVIPHDPSKMDNILKDPINSRRMIEDESDSDSFQEIKNIKKHLDN